MNSYTIDRKCRSRYSSTKTAGELKYCNSFGRFNKTIIPLALVGYEIVIANEARSNLVPRVLSISPEKGPWLRLVT